MRWPWSKKEEEIAPLSQVEPTPQSPIERVWVPRVGEWRESSICHCGFVCGDPPDVCPVCGHRDKWETGVTRDEWEEETLVRDGSPVFFVSFWPHPKRREKTVRWTSEHCGVKP